MVGPQAAAEAICIGPDDDMEQRRADIIAAVQRVDGGSGVIILTDMFGGTPSNLAISVMQPKKVDVVAGVNLPMLIKLAGVRANSDLATAVSQVREAGQKYIHVASQLLANGVSG